MRTEKVTVYRALQSEEEQRLAQEAGLRVEDGKAYLEKSQEYPETVDEAVELLGEEGLLDHVSRSLTLNTYQYKQGKELEAVLGRASAKTVRVERDAIEKLAEAQGMSVDDLLASL